MATLASGHLEDRVANLESIRPRVDFEGGLATDELTPLLLADAQTSGGLLAAVAPGAVSRIVEALRAVGVEPAVIGHCSGPLDGVCVKSDGSA